MGDASTATFAYTWAGSGRTNHPFSDAILKCHKQTCNENRTCIAEKCYKEAAEVYPPLSGGGIGMTVPYMMRRALGRNVKMIVMLREPAERMHAAFWALDHYQHKYGATEEGFEAYVEDSLKEFEMCRKKYSLEECVFAFEAMDQENEDVFYHCDQLLKSLYLPFVDGWVAAFPRNDILFLRTEDLIKDTPATMTLVLKHLGLEHPPADVFEKMVTMEETRGSKNRSEMPARGEMTDEAARMLRDFFVPFNRILATVIGQYRFVWSDVNGGRERRSLAGGAEEKEDMMGLPW